MNDLYALTPATLSGHPSLDRWNTIINKVAIKAKVMPNLVKAIMLHESGGDPQLVSFDGGCGLMQITSGVVWPCGINANYLNTMEPKYNGFDVLDPLVNISAACKKFLVPSMTLFPFDIDAVIAAYNAGDSAVQKAITKGQSPASATYAAWYVPLVHASYTWFQGQSPR